MKKSQYFWKSLMNAAGVLVYTSAVAWLMSNGQNIFSKVKEPNFLIPVFMLLLLIISASITGLLVFGKPVLLYLNGLKKEAVVFLFATLAWLVFFFSAIVAVLLLR